MKSVDHLYENFKKAILDGLGEKYRYLHFNTKKYPNIHFKISQIRQERNRMAPSYEDGFGFSAPWEEIIRNMMIKFRDETGFIMVDLNNDVFTLTELGITELKRRDQSLI